MGMREADRDRIGQAIYRAWCQMNTTLGPWHTLKDWQKENFRILADAATDAIASRARPTSRVVRIEPRGEQAAG